MDTIVFLSLFAAVFYAVSIYAHKIGRQRLIDGVREIPDFEATHHYLYSIKSRGIAIDAEKRKIAIFGFVDSQQNAFTGKIFNLTVDAADILEVQVVKNNLFTQEQQGGSLIGAVIGVMMVGPWGILAGVRDSKGSVEKVTNLSLKIRTKDISNPLHEVTFFRSSGSDPSSEGVVQQARMLEQWDAMLHALIAK